MHYARLAWEPDAPNFVHLTADRHLTLCGVSLLEASWVLGPRADKPHVTPCASCARAKLAQQVALQVAA